MCGVKVFGLFSDSETGLTEETFVVNRQLNYLYEKAKPDTAYRVAVWAETNAGEGPKVIRSVRTWPLKGIPFCQLLLILKDVRGTAESF